MQKLTKQQAQDLKDKIYATGYIVASAVGQKVFEIINECTIKEFPRFVMEGADNDNFIEIEFECSTNSIDLAVYDADASLTFEEFKQFTEGCQKICEWLEETNIKIP